MASAFGVSPYEYVTGEPPGSLAGLAFDYGIWAAGMQAKARARSRGK